MKSMTRSPRLMPISINNIFRKISRINASMIEADAVALDFLSLCRVPELLMLKLVFTGSGPSTSSLSFLLQQEKQESEESLFSENCS